MRLVAHGRADEVTEAVLSRVVTLGSSGVAPPLLVLAVVHYAGLNGSVRPATCPARAIGVDPRASRLLNVTKAGRPGPIPIRLTTRLRSAST